MCIELEKNIIFLFGIIKEAIVPQSCNCQRHSFHKTCSQCQLVLEIFVGVSCIQVQIKKIKKFPRLYREALSYIFLIKFVCFFQELNLLVFTRPVVGKSIAYHKYTHSQRFQTTFAMF